MRVPITDETAPDEGDFDQLVAILSYYGYRTRAMLTGRGDFFWPAGG